MTQPLDWTHPVATIPDEGLNIVRTATVEELAALARALDVLSVTALAATYRLRRLAGDRIVLNGGITADVVQACVVSLEPLAEHIEEVLALELWPAELMGDTAAAPHDALDDTGPEPLEGQSVPVGRLVFEHVSAALDPYPRKDGATFEAPAAADPARSPDASPFAKLAVLKAKLGQPEPEQ